MVGGGGGNPVDIGTTNITVTSISLVSGKTQKPGFPIVVVFSEEVVSAFVDVTSFA